MKSCNSARMRMINRILHLDDGNTRLPFGLCKEFGIRLPEGASPKQAWEALEDTGVNADEAYAALGDDGDIAEYVKKIKKDWSEEKIKKVKYLNRSRSIAREIWEEINLLNEVQTKGLGEVDMPTRTRYLYSGGIDSDIGHIKYRISKSQDDEEREFYQDMLDRLEKMKTFKEMTVFLNVYKNINDGYADIKTLEKKGENTECLRMHSEKIAKLANDQNFKESIASLKGYSPEMYVKVRKDLKKISYMEQSYAFQDRYGRLAFGAYDVSTLSFNEKAQKSAISRITDSEYGKSHPKLAKSLAREAMSYADTMKNFADKIKAISKTETLSSTAKEEEYNKLKKQIQDMYQSEKTYKGRTSIFCDIMKNGLREMMELCNGDCEKIIEGNKKKYRDMASGKYNNPRATKENCIKGMHTKFNESEITKDRIENATVCFDQYMSRHVLGNPAKPILEKATKLQKKAITEYTGPSDNFNLPLSGYAKATGDDMWSKSTFEGVGNVDLNEYGAKKQINALTEIINKSELDRDFMLERGVVASGIMALFGTDDISYGALEEIVDSGKILHQSSFCSCGASEGTALPSNMMLDIFCAKGTKGLYVSPLSAFGVSDEKMKDAMQDMHYFDHASFEDEVVLQRDTYFKPMGIRRDDRGKIHITLAVVEQAPLDYNKLR